MAKANGSTNPVCFVEGCTSLTPHRKKSCSYHQNTCHVNGCESTKSVNNQRNCDYHATTCHLEDCEKPRGSSKYCPMHNARLVKTGSFDAPPEFIQKPCSIDNCDRPHKGLGYCEMHLRRLRKYGSTDERPKTTRLCSVEGCIEKHLAAGFCNKHYTRNKKFGNPHFMHQAARGEPMTFLERLTNNLPPPPSCVEWPYQQSRYGYGAVIYEGRTMRAHRLSLMLHTGYMTPDRWELACHKCDNPICVNPAHLYWGSPQDNANDRVNHGRHICGEDVNTAKLMPDDVFFIRSSKLDAVTLAKKYGVAKETIAAARKGLTWKHLL